MRHEILMWKTPTLTMEIKKPQGLKPTNVNLLYEIKLHKLTYNFTHILDIVTPNCFSGSL